MLNPKLTYTNLSYLNISEYMIILLKYLQANSTPWINHDAHTHFYTKAQILSKNASQFSIFMLILKFHPFDM